MCVCCFPGFVRDTGQIISLYPAAPSQQQRRALCALFFVNDLPLARALLSTLYASTRAALRVTGTAGSYGNKKSVVHVPEEYTGHVSDAAIALRLLAHSLQALNTGASDSRGSGSSGDGGCRDNEGLLGPIEETVLDLLM